MMALLDALTKKLGWIYSLLSAKAFVSDRSPSYSHFVIAAGAILGICAGLLWTAQGSLMLAYSTEQTKGRYIAMFWIIFNLGIYVHPFSSTRLKLSGFYTHTLLKDSLWIPT